MVDSACLRRTLPYSHCPMRGTVAIPLLRTLRELCPDKINCPAIRLGPAGDLFVQGCVVTDPVLLAELDLPPGEAVVRIPAVAAAVLLPELSAGSTSA